MQIFNGNILRHFTPSDFSLISVLKISESLEEFSRPSRLSRAPEATQKAFFFDLVNDEFEKFD